MIRYQVRAAHAAQRSKRPSQQPLTPLRCVRGSDGKYYTTASPCLGCVHRDEYIHLLSDEQPLPGRLQFVNHLQNPRVRPFADVAGEGLFDDDQRFDAHEVEGEEGLRRLRRAALAGASGRK